MKTVSPKTSWCSEECAPQIADTAFVGQTASIIGHVEIGANVMVWPGASIRGDEGGKIFIGRNTNIQDNVVLHGLKGKTISVKNSHFSIYVSEEVSCAHAAVIHGPVFIGRNTFIGFGSIIHSAYIGENCYIGHGTRIIGVIIPNGKFVPHGVTISSQSEVERLPEVPEENKNFNREVVDVNVELAKAYFLRNARLCTEDNGREVLVK